MSEFDAPAHAARTHFHVTTTLRATSALSRRRSFPRIDLWFSDLGDTETNMPIGRLSPVAHVAFEILVTRGFCNSHCLSHFAAFFIDMGTQISIVENEIFGCLVTIGAKDVVVLAH